jgi:hypothetical protein
VLGFSEFARELNCLYCRKPNPATEWRTLGDVVPFYCQREPGKHNLSMTCPHCDRTWYVVWDDDPGPIERLSLAGEYRPDPPGDEVGDEGERLRRKQSERIDVTCPQCGTSISARVAYVGKKVRHNKCGHSFVLKLPTTAAKDDNDELSLAETHDEEDPTEQRKREEREHWKQYVREMDRAEQEDEFQPQEVDDLMQEIGGLGEKGDSPLQVEGTACTDRCSYCGNCFAPSDQVKAVNFTLKMALDTLGMRTHRALGTNPGQSRWLMCVNCYSEANSLLGLQSKEQEKENEEVPCTDRCNYCGKYFAPTDQVAAVNLKVKMVLDTFGMRPWCPASTHFGQKRWAMCAVCYAEAGRMLDLQ